MCIGRDILRRKHIVKWLKESRTLKVAGGGEIFGHELDLWT